MKNTSKKILSVAISAIMLVSSINSYAETSNTEGNSEAVYTTEAITPDITLFSEGTKLVNGTDYDLTYENNINVGEATIYVTFKGNYTGTRTVNFNIVAQELSNDSVAITEIGAYTYTGSEIKPDITVKVGETVLINGTDYDVVYSNNTNVGTATANINFKGNYSGSATANFEIIAKAVTEQNVTIAPIENQTYTGDEIKPEVVITEIVE